MRFLPAFFGIVVIVSFFSSCITLGTVEIEVIKPAKITIPSGVNSLLILNNSLVFPSDTFKHEIQKGLFSLDTATTQLISYQVNEIINESPRFDTSILIPKLFFRKSADSMKPLHWESISKLCEKYNTDAVLSIEAFGIVDTMVRLKYYNGYEYSSYNTLVLLVNSMWRVYLNDEKKVLEKRIFRDTIFINEIESRNAYLDAVTHKNDIDFLSQEIANNISIDVADRLAPFWQPEQRSFFIYQNNEMNQAASYAYNDNWRGAALIWKTLTDSKNTKIAASACFNMALVCEIEGRLDLAESWLLESLKAYKTQTAYDYLLTIRKRKAEAEKLNKQFGVTQ